MYIFWITALTILLLYSIRIFRYRAGWKRAAEFSPDSYSREISISVIVPFRNEENNIQGLIKDLANQNYPGQLYEVLLIDDHSEDSTAGIIKNYCRDISNFRLIQLPVNISGKKAAIKAGIENAAGKLIITTDADCRTGRNWISAVTSFYLLDDKPKMIIGLVDLLPEASFFKKFQQLEFLSLIGSGAGAAGISHPVYCNGANLIYEKELYYKFRDPLSDTSVSGDDTLFMLKVKKNYQHEIKLLKSRDAIVYTKPQLSFRDFIRQRIRWASKAKYYKDYDIIYTSIVVFALNVSILISMILMFTGNHFLLYPALLTGKTIADFTILNSILKFFNKRDLLNYLIIFQIIYPLYISFTGILGNIAGYKWKNRKYAGFNFPFLK
jgi:cellulose synthase/poly-beta-1,6-N-acetylglucosamine synthase-like glycosyltransferase